MINNLCKNKKPVILQAFSNECDTGNSKNTTRCTDAYPYLQGDTCYQRIECSHSGAKKSICTQAMYREKRYMCANNKIAAKKDIAQYDGKTRQVEVRLFDSYGDGLNGTELMWTWHKDGITEGENLDNTYGEKGWGDIVSNDASFIGLDGVGGTFHVGCDIPSTWACSYGDDMYQEEVSFTVMGQTYKCEPGGGPLHTITIPCSNCPVDDGIKDAGCTDSHKYRTTHADHGGLYCYNTKACAHSLECWNESGGSAVCNEIAWIDSAADCPVDDGIKDAGCTDSHKYRTTHENHNGAYCYNTKACAHSLDCWQEAGGSDACKEIAWSAPNRDCAGSWSDWSACSGGQQSRTYNVTTSSSGNGTACPSSPETQSCIEDIDCAGSWSDWSTCSGGQQSRTYNVTTSSSGSGTACPSSPETQSCLANGACRDGGDGACYDNDGAGYTYDNCLSWSANKDYTENTYQYVFATGKTCEEAGWVDRDCAGSWSDWSACSGGQQSRTYNVTTSPLGSGTACPSSPETQSCIEEPAADPCECKQTCGTQSLWQGQNWCYTEGTCNYMWKYCDVPSTAPSAGACRDGPSGTCYDNGEAKYSYENCLSWAANVPHKDTESDVTVFATGKTCQQAGWGVSGN